MKKILYAFLMVSTMVLSSCSDFLDRAPSDALSPTTFWSSESDAKLALTGCYHNLESIYGGYNMIYWDCTADNYFNNFSWEGYKTLSDGNNTANDTGTSFFSFLDIRACNEYLENEANVKWSSEATENQYKAEARVLRAIFYFWKTECYGDFPFFTSVAATPEDSKVERTAVATIREFIVKELTDCLQYLPDKSNSSEGRINKQFCEGLLMRYYLYRSDYTNALKYANMIRESGQVNIPAGVSYADCFLTANQYDSETIFDHSYIASTSMDLYDPPFLANGIGGWSSVVPTLDLMDAFECTDGKTIDESPLYDPTEPFLNRDPRLRASILYPGQVYSGYATCYNSMPSTIGGAANNDYCTNADNCSKSGLQLGKYFQAANINPNSISSTTLHFKVMRYAEVLLTIAECEIELGTNTADAVACINKIRSRAGMPNVDETVYSTQAKLRELVRRERRVELNGEGLRRADLVRWGTITSIMSKFKIQHLDGDVTSEKDANGDYKVKVTGRSNQYTNYNFTADHILFPIYQKYIDINPKLKQNPGYN
jgi:hypothetical protein